MCLMRQGGETVQEVHIAAERIMSPRLENADRLSAWATQVPAQDERHLPETCSARWVRGLSQEIWIRRREGRGKEGMEERERKGSARLKWKIARTGPARLFVIVGPPTAVITGPQSLL